LSKLEHVINAAAHRFIDESHTISKHACVCGKQGSHAEIEWHITESLLSPPPRDGTSGDMKEDTMTTTLTQTNGHSTNGSPAEAPPIGLRLRMKVWTDPATNKRYLMPTASMPSARSDVMTAYAMTDEDTKLVKITVREWNMLPFFYFQEEGPAPRASARPVDEVR